MWAFPFQCKCSSVNLIRRRISTLKKYFPIGILVIAAAVMISAVVWAAISKSNGSQVSKAQDLTSLNAADAAAYRYTAMAKYYDSLIIPVTGSSSPVPYSPLAMASQYREHVYPDLSSSPSSPRYYFVPYMEMSFSGPSPMMPYAAASSSSSPRYYFVPYMEMSFLGTPPMIY